MEISKGILIRDLALYTSKTLVLSDTHIGYEEALNKQGILVPRFQFNEIIKRLGLLFQKTRKLDKIIVNGDIKHEFGTISEQEWRLTLQLIDFLAEYCKELILVRGNHDTILGPIAKKRNIKVVDHVKIKDILIVHGDKLPEKNLLKGVKRIIIGHEHPAISLYSGNRREIYKCFLKGRWKSREIIVLPSFSTVAEGTDVLKEKLLSPFLKNIGDFKVFAVSDSIYDFGKIKDLRRI